MLPTPDTLDDEVIEQAIQLRQQKKMKLGDAIIAATAVAYNIPRATRNEDDFKHIPGQDLETRLRSPHDPSPWPSPTNVCYLGPDAQTPTHRKWGQKMGSKMGSGVVFQQTTLKMLKCDT